MKKIILCISIVLCCISCKQKEKQLTSTVAKKETVEYFDSIRNFYANYRYNVAVSAPRNWKREGVSQHTIFRTIEKDSGYTFSVNVIETPYEVEKTFWQEYSKNESYFIDALKEKLEKTINTKAQTVYVKSSYIKNYKSLKQRYNYTISNNDMDFEMTYLTHQVPINNLTYTFGLVIPKIFYEHQPDYFDGMFEHIWLLSNNDDLEKIISNYK